MAAAASEEAKEEKVKSGAPIIPLILGMLLTVGGSVGGALLWLTKSGRLPVQGFPAKQAEATKPETAKTKLIALDPLLVNLADGNGAGYLRVAIALRAEEPPPAKDVNAAKEEKAEKGKVLLSESDVMLRDAALDVLGRETSDELLKPGGKDHLKDELRSVLQKRVPEARIVDVMFTEFLVQR